MSDDHSVNQTSLSRDVGRGTWDVGRGTWDVGHAFGTGR
jgi:hypothetical protein